MEQKLKQFIAEHQTVYFFGIGNYGAALAERLPEIGLDFAGFIATSKTQADSFTQAPLDSFMSKPVYLVDEVRGATVLALPEKYQPAAEKILRDAGFRTFFHCSDDYMISNVRRSNTLTAELVDSFRREVPFQTVEHKPWREILVVCLGGIGDMVMTTPFLRELKRNHPTAAVTMITTPISFNLMQTLPFIDHVVAFDWKKNIGTLRQRMEHCRHFIDELLQARSLDAFDAAPLPGWDVDLYVASFLIFFSRAAVRLGFSEHVNSVKASFNRNFDLLFSEVVDDREYRYDVDYKLVLLKHFGELVVNRNPEIFPTPEDHEKAARLLKEHLEGDTQLIVLGISATAPNRVWARENYAALIDRLHERHPELRFLIVGGHDAVAGAAHIIENTPRGIAIDLTDRLTLRESAAICYRASIYVGNNTGAMHLAAASGTLCVGIFPIAKDDDDHDSDSPARTRPVGEGHVCLQPEHTLDDCTGHCLKPFAHCINQITVAEVCESVEKILPQCH